jgi:hypothetical protein
MSALRLALKFVYATAVFLCYNESSIFGLSQSDLTFVFQTNPTNSGYTYLFLRNDEGSENFISRNLKCFGFLHRPVYKRFKFY